MDPWVAFFLGAFAVFVYGNIRVLQQGTIPKPEAVYGYALYSAVMAGALTYFILPDWMVLVVAVVAFAAGCLVFRRFLRVVPK